MSSAWSRSFAIALVLILEPRKLQCNRFLRPDRRDARKGRTVKKKEAETFIHNINIQLPHFINTANDDKPSTERRHMTLARATCPAPILVQIPDLMDGRAHAKRYFRSFARQTAIGLFPIGTILLR